MKRLFILYIFVLLAGIYSCSKSSGSGENIIPPPVVPPVIDSSVLSYGDSVFYVKEGEDTNIIRPVGSRKGKYIGFPDGIELNELTGAIDINESETGLRYRITFIPDGTKDTLSTIILLSGINFLDNIYYMDENDTTALPFYNGRIENRVPGSDGNSVFDEGGGCKAEGVAVNTRNGTINLAESIRNGALGDHPSNGKSKEVELRYRVSDDSKKALNKLKVKLYYFDTPDDITEDLIQLMADRKGMFLGMESQGPFFEFSRPVGGGTVISSNSVAGTAKPRPPCIFVVGSRRTK